jgi:CHAT domain
MVSEERPGIIEADRRTSLSMEWDRLVEQVRELDQFKDFLRPLRIDALLPVAQHGPVAVINISEWRCDALVVGTSQVEVVKLHHVTAAVVAEHVQAYLQALRQVDQAVQKLHEARRRYDGGENTLAAVMAYTQAKQAVLAANHARDETLNVILRWLWDEIAEPVLSFLGFRCTPSDGQPWPRLWWCPTGLLTLLPLHAAGCYDARGQSAGEAVPDRVVSSYTPTLRALLEARQPWSLPPSGERLLVVALAETVGQLPLDGADRDRNLLASLFSERCTLLRGADATWQAVHRMLPRHRWVHFSCHGGQDLMNPTRGGLLLHDRLLTIADIGPGKYRGEFAFLSACQTATGGVGLPDEAITLVAAMHYSGYRHVIGTLWSVYDQTASDVAEAVYRDLTLSGRFEPARSAQALHSAIQGLREQGIPASAWVPFIHTGP